MPSPLRRHWSLAAALLALAALFGMHGLGDHSGAHLTRASQHHVMTAPALDVGAASASPDEDPGLPGPAFLCLAVLVGGAVALLALRRPGRRTPWLLPRLARATAPPPRGRDPDPPRLAELSVCRC